MDLNHLQRILDEIMREQNNRSVPKFEGYSPFEMHHLLYSTLEKESPIQLQRLTEADCNKIPILNLAKHLIDLIDKNKEIKLTQKGYLPLKIVSELFQTKYTKDKRIYLPAKQFKEIEVPSIHLARILLEISGLIKIKNGKMSLSQNTKKIAADNNELLRLLWETFTNKFNWAYFDLYGENDIGQFGYGFSLILLSKYGHVKRLDSFYAEKYFIALPLLLERQDAEFRQKRANVCYSFRTFRIFLNYFGLAEFEIGPMPEAGLYIQKTELFDKLIKCKPHKSY